jgi:hypothetical protein
MHCKQHLTSITSHRCDITTYRHTVLRPGYCLFCLNNSKLSASSRMHQWTRSNKLWNHIETHIHEHAWPSICPHTLCDIQLDTAASFRYHLSDIHGFRRQVLSGRGKRHHHKEKEAKLELNSSDDLRDQTKKGKRKKGDGGWLVRKKQNTEIQEMDKYSMPFIEWRCSQPSALQSQHSTTRMKPYPTPAFENTVFGDDLADYSSPSVTPPGATTEQPAAFTDPIISPTLTLLSSASPPAGDYNHDAGCPIARDLTYTGTSPSSSTMFCRSENCASTRDGSQCSLEVDYNMNGLSEEIQWTELPVNSKELTDITIVDLTEDRPSAYDDLLSQYTTISSSTCSSIRASDDDNKGLSDLVSGKSSLPPEIETPPANTIDCGLAEPDENAQIKPRKSVIKLRLNPPKPPMPKILLRVKQPEQVSSQKHRGPVGKNNRRVRNPAPTTKKPRRKRRSQY